MKKIVLILCSAIFAFSALAFASCGETDVQGNGKEPTDWETEDPSVIEKPNEETPKDEDPEDKREIETFRVYSAEEIEKDSVKEYVQLSYYPAEQTDAKNRFAIVCPGGGYTSLEMELEGSAIADALNGYGITAFVLQYSNSKNVENGGIAFRPQRDLYAAVKYVVQNSNRFSVDLSDYALFGFSAGANLVSTYLTDDMASYCEYDLTAVQKPSCIVLSYPWLNLEEYNRYLKAGVTYVMGNAVDEEKSSLLCPYKHLDASYPPVYMWWSKNDTLVQPETNELLMEEALKQNNVVYSTKVVEGLGHGGGLNKGNVAEGWLEEAVEFWTNLK